MNLNITFRQLEIFAAVARNLSYTQASEELHLSQPAVSMQVKQIEHLINKSLTEKIGKKLFLTDAGKIMRDYANRILTLRRTLGDTLQSLDGIETGHISIAVPETANQFVTLILAQFRKQHPRISFNLQIYNRKGLLNCLKHNTADLVIMGQTPINLDLITEKFMKNPLVVIAPPKHPLAKQRHLQLTDLKDYEFVVREPGSGTRLAMQRFFSEHNANLKTIMEMPNNEAIKQAVAAGLGLGIVSLHTLQQELALKQVSILDIKELPIMRTWYLVEHKHKSRSPVLNLFKQFVVANAQAIWVKKYPQLLQHL